MSYDEAAETATDFYLAGLIELNPNMTTTAAELEAALASWHVTVTEEN